MAEVQYPDSDNGVTEQGTSTDPYPPELFEAMQSFPVFEPSPEQIDTRAPREKAASVAIYGIPATIMGGAKEIIESMPGLDGEDGMAFVKALSTEGMFKFFQEHQEGSETAGALTTALVPILGVTKAMKAPSVFNKVKGLVGEKSARAILGSQKTIADRVQKLREEAILLAKSQQNVFTKEQTPGLIASMKKEIGFEALDTLKMGVYTDTAIYGLLNENEFFFPDDMTMTEMALFYGLPNIVVSGITGAMTRKGIKNAFREAGQFADFARNEAGIPIMDVLNTKGTRGVYTTTFAAHKQAQQHTFINAGTDEIFAKNANAQANAANDIVNSALDDLAQDVSVPGVSQKAGLQSSEKHTLNAALDEDYSALFHAQSIESLALKTPQDYIEGLMTARKTAQKNVQKARIEMEKITNKNSIEYAQAKVKYQKAHYHAQNMNEHFGMIINRDGSFSLAANTSRKFEDTATGRFRKTTQEFTPRMSRDLQPGDLLRLENKDTGRYMIGAKTGIFGNSGMTLVRDDLRMIPADRMKSVPRILQDTAEEFKSLKYEDLSFHQKTAALYTMRKAVAAHTIPETGRPVVITPNKDMNFVELDGVLELAEKYGIDSGGYKAAINLTGDLKTLEEVEFASLAKKYEAWRATRLKDAKAFIKNPHSELSTREDLLVTHNLPNDGVSGPHPLVQMFEEMFITETKHLGEKYKDLRAIQNSLQTLIPERTEGMIVNHLKTPAIKLRGSQLKTFTHTVDGKVVEQLRKPVFVFGKAKYENPLMAEEIKAAAMRDRSAVLQKLKDADREGAPFIGMHNDIILENPARYETGVNVGYLTEGSQTRKGTFTQITHGVEDDPVMTAIDSMGNAFDNAAGKYIQDQFKRHEQTFAKILAHTGKADLDSFAVAVNQQGNGWRGTPNFEAVVDDAGELVGYKILLEDHSFNEKMAQKLFGKSASDIKYMPEPTFGKVPNERPMVVSPLAAETMLAFNEISQDVLKHINYLRKINNKPPISAKALHLPPKNLSDKEIIYLMDRSTSTIASVQSGNTATQVRRLAEEEIANAKKQGVELVELTSDDISRYNLVKLEAFATIQDYSTSFAQTGAAKGSSFGRTIETGASVVERMQQTLIKQYKSVSGITRAIAFEPAIRQAEFQIKTAQLGKKQALKQETIWDQWSNRLFGRKSGNKHKFIGKFYGAVEDIYDEALQGLWDEKVQMFKTGLSKQAAEKRQAGMQKLLGDYNPFKDSVEFLENTMQVRTPTNMIQHMSKINNVMSLAMLRMGEIGLGLINLMTLPTLIPSTAKALKRMPHESVQDWKGRIGAWGSVIDDDIVIWNPTRATTTGMHFATSLNPAIAKERAEVLKRAADKNHLWQEAVERMQVFTAPKEGYVEKFLIHKAAKTASWFVDTTEHYSRSISYLTFYKMGRDALKLNMDDAMTFAHHQANKVIGDFRPNVRPEVYQGAVGMPFGLFTTFAWNYLQRVFGYLEKGQFKAFMNQMGVQAAFFGHKSLPGFNSYVDHFTDNYDGSQDLGTRLDSAFGTEFTDVFNYGAIGGLTGMAFTSRVEVGLPLGNLRYAESPLDFSPAVSWTKQVYKGAAQLAKSPELTTQQTLEVAGTAFPVKSMRGWFQLMAGGQVDNYGKIIDDELYNAMDIFSRIADIKTVRNQKQLEELRRLRGQDLKQAEERRHLNRAYMAALRGGDFDIDVISTLYKEYVGNGGDPKYFQRFLKDKAIEGLVPKEWQVLINTSKKYGREAETLRLMDVMSDDFE